MIKFFFEEFFSTLNPNNIFDKKLTNIFFAVLGILFIWTIYVQFNPAILFGNFTTGDWLINYAGGFVRRGLVGEISLYIAELLSVNVVYIVAALKIFFCFLLFTCLMHIISIKKINIIDSIYFFMPWALSFYVTDIYESSRKDIIFLAFFVLYILLDLKLKKSVSFKFAYLLFTCLFIVLAHEGSFFFLHFFLIYELMQGKMTEKEILYTFLPLSSILFVLMYVLFYFKGDPSHVAAIQASVKNYVPEKTLHGAIAALGVSHETFKVTVESIKSYCIVYLLFLLFIIKYMYVYALDRKKITYTFLGLLLSMPLFILGIDWGRWMHMAFFSTFICLFTTRSIQKTTYVKYNILSACAIIISTGYVFVVVMFFDLVHFNYSFVDARLQKMYTVIHSIVF